jgi:hypothetical protein
MTTAHTPDRPCTSGKAAYRISSVPPKCNQRIHRTCYIEPSNCYTLVLAGFSGGAEASCLGPPLSCGVVWLHQIDGMPHEPMQDRLLVAAGPLDVENPGPFDVAKPGQLDVAEH